MVEREGTGRTGAVDATQAIHQDLAPTDPDAFASEGAVFLRRVENLLGVRTYERVGIRISLEAPAPESVEALANGLLMGTGGRPRWALNGQRFRFEGEQDGWGVIVQVQPLFR